MKTQNLSDGIVLTEADSNFAILYIANESREVPACHLAWLIQRFEKDIPILNPNPKYCVNLQFLKAFNGNFLMINNFQWQISVSLWKKERV